MTNGLGTTGALVISLDFELYWGVRDKRALSSCQENLHGTRQVIPAILELFQKYEIHATWATVGFLFCESREELMSTLPGLLPDYADANLSPYRYLQSGTVGERKQADPYHYAPSLIRLISSYPHQFIGSHTHSHYYCLEPGQTAQTFEADLAACKKVARKKGHSPTSIVFPRNQLQPAYLALCKKHGFTSYRGNEPAWMYRAGPGAEDSLFKRALRLADSYVNLSGHHAYDKLFTSREGLVNVPSSRFLRPYSPKLRFLEDLRYARIRRDLLFAAKNQRLYHLWWHPENFGSYPAENLRFLERLLAYFADLRRQYGMQSLSMEEAAADWNKQKEGRHEAFV
ncbi:polysaccharide deacetylase family protein [Brevibacillus sp. HD3.3A]|uniref:polysaccharide deacetylase family protein n=1 Tax=Brevibacillus sp. HD3.3A TaxID=2738979 RepID=UPI001E52CE40|nr:polysaccharide deacetylase family protein [Brevibacillus sp. HD3.3A]UED67634.1 polysaccharide deacetylase family protein [Brevibacillus sp. HD3.3A]